MHKSLKPTNPYLNLPIGVVLVDRKARVIQFNRRVVEILIGAGSTKRADALGERLGRIFKEDALPFSAIKKTRLPLYGVEKQIEKPDGTTAIISLNSTPLWDGRSRFQGIIATIEDITDSKLNQDDRENLIEELTIQSRQMEELNDALKVLLDQRDKDKEDFEEKIVLNLTRLVIPYLEKIRGRLLPGEQRACLEVALSNLNDLFSAFATTLSSHTYGLTPRELEIANLVRQGKSSQDIADSLYISVRSVETHRRSIRHKLGLKGKGVNLRSFLSSLK